MTGENRPLSEIYREAANEWAEKEAAAQLLEDTKSAIMAQMIVRASTPDVPFNKTEAAVKASQEWLRHVESIVDSRKSANLAKVNLEYIRMQFTEWNNEQANHRAESRL